MQKIIVIRPSSTTPPAPGSLRAIQALATEAQAAAAQFRERGNVITVYHPDRLCHAPWPDEPTLEEWARSARASRCKWNASAHLLRAMTDTATARQARTRRARGNQCR